MAGSSIIPCCCSDSAADTSCTFEETFTVSDVPNGTYESKVIIGTTFEVDESELTKLGNFCKTGENSAHCQVTNNGCFDSMGGDAEEACLETYGCQAIWEDTGVVAQGVTFCRTWLSRWICNSGSSSVYCNVAPTAFATRERFQEFNVTITLTNGVITNRTIENLLYDNVEAGSWSDPDEIDTISGDLGDRIGNFNISPASTWSSGVDSFVSSEKNMECNTSHTFDNPTNSNYTSVLELRCTNTNHDGWNDFKGCCNDDSPASTGVCTDKKEIICDESCGNIQSAVCSSSGCTWSNPAETAIHKGKVSFIAVKMNTSSDSHGAVNSIEVRATRACKTGCTSGNTMCYKLTFNFWYGDARLTGFPVSIFANDANKVFEKYGLPLEFVAIRPEFWSRVTLDSSSFDEITFTDASHRFGSNADPCLARTNFGASGSGWHNMISTKTLKFNAVHSYTSGESENIKFTATGLGGVYGGYMGCGDAYSSCSAGTDCDINLCGGSVGTCTSTTFVSIPIQGTINVEIGGSDTFTATTLGTNSGCGCLVKWS